MREFRWRYLGRQAYGDMLSFQEQLHRARCDGEEPERLLLLEHFPVITVGRRRPPDLRVSPAWLAARGVAVVETERGGRTIYHGPGQLVGYVICRVGRKVLHFVRAIEEVLLAAVGDCRVHAWVRADAPGLWTAGGKLGMIGLQVERGVTRHGFALNVDCDLEPFAWIDACGERRAAVTSLATVRGEHISLQTVRAHVLARWAERFGPLREESLEPPAGRDGFPHVGEQRP